MIWKGCCRVGSWCSMRNEDMGSAEGIVSIPLPPREILPCLRYITCTMYTLTHRGFHPVQNDSRGSMLILNRVFRSNCIHPIQVDRTNQPTVIRLIPRVSAARRKCTVYRGNRVFFYRHLMIAKAAVKPA